MSKYVPRSHKGWDEIIEVKEYVRKYDYLDLALPRVKKLIQGFGLARMRAQIRSLVVNGIDSVE